MKCPILHLPKVNDQVRLQRELMALGFSSSYGLDVETATDGLRNDGGSSDGTSIYPYIVIHRMYRAVSCYRLTDFAPGALSCYTTMNSAAQFVAYARRLKNSHV